MKAITSPFIPTSNYINYIKILIIKTTNVWCSFTASNVIRVLKNKYSLTSVLIQPFLQWKYKTTKETGK